VQKVRWNLLNLLICCFTDCLSSPVVHIRFCLKPFYNEQIDDRLHSTSFSVWAFWPKCQLKVPAGPMSQISIPPWRNESESYCSHDAHFL
jgi:hypothetical protein